MITGFNITSPARTIASALQQKIDNKTKPRGSLGILEQLAFKVGLVQQSLTPRLTNPHVLVFSGDHGIAREGVSAYPQEVTYQMVLNFVRGGAAINVFSDQNGINLKVVDAGVNFDFGVSEKILDAKVGYGTKNFLNEEAMTHEQLLQAIDKGAAITREIVSQRCNIVGFGEMGIGNTASASMIMSRVCNFPLEVCVGRGTGLNDKQLSHKLSILKRAGERHVDVKDPQEVLRVFGGFEIAEMCGSMLAAAEARMILLVDGFISTAAFLVASALYPDVKHYAVLSHCSQEAGHRKMCEYLEMKPLLNLGLRLGEGTGSALAYPLLKNAVSFLSEMASFDTAKVAKKVE